jgi:hypothetical protein
MACSKAILTYTSNCDKVTVAGVQNLYLVGYSSLVPLTGSTEVYAVGANDMVNEIGATGGDKFVKIGILPKAVALKNPYAYDPATGLGEYTEELTLPVSNVSVDSRKLVKSLVGQPVSALVKLTSGVWLAMGLDGMMYVTAVEAAVDGVANAYTITFSGTSADFTPIVDPTIVTGLIA